jgi:hypothetical protein
MGSYYLCGYSNQNIIISKPLIMKKITTNFDGLLFKNKIFSESPFDLSIKLNENETIELFIVYCINRKNVYNYLLDQKNNKLNKLNKLSVLKTFNISFKTLNFNYDRIYYSLKRKYPYDILLYRILLIHLPPELILIILKFLEEKIIVSFKIDKSRRENSYYFCLPNILY